MEITWDDFKKVDVRVGTIITAEVFTAAHNASYKLTIDFGELGILKSAAQITILYDVDNLVGKQIVAVVNLPKKQIANIMSECLVLGVVGEGERVVLVTPDKPVKNGQKIA